MNVQQPVTAAMEITIKSLKDRKTFQVALNWTPGEPPCSRRVVISPTNLSAKAVIIPLSAHPIGRPVSQDSRLDAEAHQYHHD